MLELNTKLFTAESVAPRASTLVKDFAGRNDASRVYSEIFDAVMDRRLLPGAKLTEAALCKIFNCSRATVRCALAELAHDKIVDIRPNRGASVWQPGSKETQDVFEMRRAVECLVIDKLLALTDLGQRLTPLYDMVVREQRAFESGDRVSWLRLSHAFHVKMAALAGNDVLTELMHSLCARSTLIIAYHDAPGRRTCSYIEHKAILDLLMAGNRDGVSAAMHDHLQALETRVAEAGASPADPWAAFGVRL